MDWLRHRPGAWLKQIHHEGLHSTSVLRRSVARFRPLVPRRPGSGRGGDGCPSWDITVVDESGKPLAGCAVVQEWGCQFREDYVAGSRPASPTPTGKSNSGAQRKSPTESRGKKVQRGIDPRGTVEPRQP